MSLPQQMARINCCLRGIKSGKEKRIYLEKNILRLYIT